MRIQQIKFENTKMTKLYLMVLIALSTQNAYTYSPASPHACIAIESSGDRLSCYDSIFNTKPEVLHLPPSEDSTLKLISDKVEESKNAEEKIWNDTNLFAYDEKNNKIKNSLLDTRWELTPESKLGTWNLRAYQPIYLLPAIWTSEKNELPSSPNPNNTVTDNQNLKSIEAKLQLSLKTKALENVFGDNGDVWIGYTQSARWQVYNEDESRPFRETNYEPEISLVFKTDYNILGLDGNLLGLTFNHQSNGRSDPLSRSWNRALLNIGLETENFAMLFRPWYRLDEDGKKDNNPDIKNYIGRADLTTFYRKNNHDFTIMLRHSLKGGVDSHGAIQFDWAFPIAGKLRGYLQVFDGYGESLIDYNHRATYVGFGLSLMNWY